MSIPNKSTAFRNEPVFSSIRAAATQVAKAKANALARSQSGAIKQVNQAAGRRQGGAAMNAHEQELIGDAIAAENVRLLLAGKLKGRPEPGTLAHRVWAQDRDYGLLI